MISIICPFYNEKPNLEELVKRLGKAARGLEESYEIIFVDDGSTDGGGEELKNLISSQNAMRLVSLEKNGGLTGAFFAGFEKTRGEIIATLDSDLQNPPEEIPRLVNLLKTSGADIVTGIRARRRDGWLKRLSSQIANGIRRAVTGDHMQDVGCSLRVFKREVLRAFLPKPGMHRFFLTLAEAEGFKIEQVSVAHEPRRHGQSKYRLSNRLLGPLSGLFMVKWRLLRKPRCKT